MLVRARTRHKTGTLWDLLKAQHYQEGSWTPAAHMERPQKDGGKTALCP